MCTLTFIPDEDGYILGMNRDEKITRAHASPPAINKNGARQAVYPRDVEGGTWIGASDSGIAFALLNWNDADPLHPRMRSRGSVIPAIVNSISRTNTDATLESFDFRGILPFRLVGVFPAEKRIVEWRWNQDSLEREAFTWHEQQWCSSSLSDAQAAMRRELSYARARHEADVGSVAWLRRLHASHDAEHAHFSMCVHRESVETLSYTEIICSAENVRFAYHSSSPCRAAEAERRVIVERRPSQTSNGYWKVSGELRTM